MGELAGEDVAEDLKVTMRVSGEARVGLYAVLVEDTQGAKMCESGRWRLEYVEERSRLRPWYLLGIVPVGKGKGVVGVEPAVVRVAASGGPVWRDLCVGECLGHGGLDSVHGLMLLLLLCFEM